MEKYLTITLYFLMSLFLVYKPKYISVLRSDMAGMKLTNTHIWTLLGISVPWLVGALMASP